MHGHSYKLFVTVKGNPINDLENPKNGMVVDFGDIKKIVKEEIVDVWDHAVSVSYTHLDVYKRQFVCAVCRPDLDGNLQS